MTKKLTLAELTARPREVDLCPGDVPSLDHVTRRVTGPTIVRDPAGEPLLAYVPYRSTRETALLRKLLPHVTTFQERARTNRLQSRATTFGFQPRIAIRRDYCAITRFSRTHPVQAELLSTMARSCAAEYEAHNPNVYAGHIADVESEVLPEWLLPRTPFTGGIINETVPLAYHRDNGNYKRTWSAMVLLRQHVEGGWLVVPGLDVAVETADLTLTMFYGQDFMHGVSPLRRVRRDARRYSIVFYSLKTMRNCLCGADEFARYREVRTVRERNRRKGVRAGE